MIPNAAGAFRTVNQCDHEIGLCGPKEGPEPYVDYHRTKLPLLILNSSSMKCCSYF